MSYSQDTHTQPGGLQDGWVIVIFFPFTACVSSWTLSLLSHVANMSIVDVSTHLWLQLLCFSDYGLAWFVLVYCISILMLRPVKGKTYRLSQVWRLPPSLMPTWLMLTCSSWGFKAKMRITLAQCYHGFTRTSGWSVGAWHTRACARKLKKKQKNPHFSTSRALTHAPVSADVQQPGHRLWHKRILVGVWLPHPECIRSLMASIDGQRREAITHVMDL